MLDAIRSALQAELGAIRSGGLFKEERMLASPQDAHVRVSDGREVLNMCANNYLGLANHPTMLAAAREALDRWGFGMASVRFICGTQKGAALRERLRANTALFRARMSAERFDILPGEHPIVPVMYGEASAAAQAASRMLEQGVYVIPFSYPVVPMGQARIRTQVSAAHAEADLERAVSAFAQAR